MPRPKRTKVAPSAPASRVKKSSKSTFGVQAPPKATQVSSDNLYDASEPEEAVVTSARHVRKNGNGKETASSVLRGRARDMHKLGGHEVTAVNQELEGSMSGEGIMHDIDLESSSPAVEVGRREHVGNSLLAIGNFKRRARQPSILGRGDVRARSSSVGSNLAHDNGLSNASRKNTSTIAMGNFKRRWRESSVVGQNATPMSISTSGGVESATPAHARSVLKIGNFKRRAREPSILRTAQKTRQQVNYDDEDEDDFNPEDESTPLHLSKTRNLNTSSVPSSSISRKRKLSAGQVPQSSPTIPSPIEVEEDANVQATGASSGEDAEDELESCPQGLIPSIEPRADSPELLSNIVAPPLSSSSLPSSPEPVLPVRRAPSRGRQLPRGRTPAPRSQESPISSPPSLTHSPNRPSVLAASARPRPKRQVPPPSTFSTAQLQALLPRRRRAARG